MADRVEATFSCKSCGASPTAIVLPDNHTDDSIAVCKNCGVEFGKYGDIKTKVRTDAQKEIRSYIRKRLKRAGFK